MRKRTQCSLSSRVRFPIMAGKLARCRLDKYRCSADPLEPNMSTTSSPVVVSGMRPTGHLHLGSYFGAIRQFVHLQERYPCYFFIADYHSLTTHPTPENLTASVRQILVEYIAAGLDPEKAVLYVQSDLPETAELYLLLAMNAYKGELERVVTFKDKARKQPDNVNAGLFTYPVLMAADILIQRAHYVPVGKDQEQHLEMTRQFANRFNRLYQTDYLPEPEAFSLDTMLVKIPGLDGSGKMGKSEGEGNALFLTETPGALKKKIMRAVTDSGPTEPNQPMAEPIANLFTLMKHTSSEEVYQDFLERYNQCHIRYGDMKKKMVEDISAFLAPIRERAEAIAADEAYLDRIMREGAEKARDRGGQTLAEVRRLIGFR